MTELLLAAKACSQCLTSRDRIVSGQRAAEIVRECKSADIHFRCHKGDIAGLNLHCRGVHDVAPSLAYRMAKAWNIPIREIDADSLK